MIDVRARAERSALCRRGYTAMLIAELLERTPDSWILPAPPPRSRMSTRGHLSALTLRSDGMRDGQVSATVRFERNDMRFLEPEHRRSRHHQVAATVRAWWPDGTPVDDDLDVFHLPRTPPGVSELADYLAQLACRIAQPSRDRSRPAHTAADVPWVRIALPYGQSPRPAVGDRDAIEQHAAAVGYLLHRRLNHPLRGGTWWTHPTPVVDTEVHQLVLNDTSRSHRSRDRLILEPGGSASTVILRVTRSTRFDSDPRAGDTVLRVALPAAAATPHDIIRVLEQHAPQLQINRPGPTRHRSTSASVARPVQRSR